MNIGGVVRGQHPTKHVEVSGDNDNSLLLITPNKAGCDNLNALAVLCREYPYELSLSPDL